MSGYDDRTVRITLAHLFNGGRWRRDDAPDPDMPKARSNPATRGTEMAEKVDVERALGYTQLVNEEALRWHLGEELTCAEIAKLQGFTTDFVRQCIDRDVQQITLAANTGLRLGWYKAQRQSKARPEKEWVQDELPFPWLDVSAWTDDSKEWGAPCGHCGIALPLDGSGDECEWPENDCG